MFYLGDDATSVPQIFKCADVNSQRPFRKCQTLSKLFGEVRLPNDSERSEVYNQVKRICNICQHAFLCVTRFQIVLYPDYLTIWQTDCSKTMRTVLTLHMCDNINPYPTAFPYGNGMVLHLYQQQESSTTKTVHKVINKGLKTYV